MSKTILNKKYQDPDRPYSQKELSIIRKNTFKRFHIGSYIINHEDCQHFYYAKTGGRKEKEAIENNKRDVGNCSVCWKLSRTPRRFKQLASKLIEDYCFYFKQEPEYLFYDIVDLESDFYTWLYNEFNPDRKE